MNICVILCVCMFLTSPITFGRYRNYEYPKVVHCKKRLGVSWGRALSNGSRNELRPAFSFSIRQIATTAVPCTTVCYHARHCPWKIICHGLFLPFTQDCHAQYWKHKCVSCTALYTQLLIMHMYSLYTCTSAWYCTLVTMHTSMHSIENTSAYHAQSVSAWLVLL